MTIRLAIPHLIVGMLGLTACSAEEDRMDVDGDRIPQVLSIRALIDRSDVLKVRGNKLWYEHRNYHLPGKWVDRYGASGNEPIFVNDQAWYPEWDGDTSQPYTATAPLLPEHTAVKVTAVTVRGRGKVNVIEQPTEQNDYTLGVLLDDDPQDGAQWYEIHLRWQ